MRVKSQGFAADQQRFVRIRLEDLSLGETLPEDIYRFNESNSRYILVASAGSVLDQGLRSAILRVSHGQVYSERKHGNKPLPNADSPYHQIITRPDLSLTGKIRLLNDHTYSLCRQLLDENLTPEDIQSAADLLEAMGFLLEREPESGNLLIENLEHSNVLFRKVANAAIYGTQLSRLVGLESKQVRTLGVGMLLRDLGMLRMPGELIQREGPLTDYLARSLRRHTRIGAALLQETRLDVEPFLPVVLHHHERIDGSGYPDGLKRSAIPVEAQIAGLVDSFVAIAGRHRSQGDHRPVFTALCELAKEVPTRYDKQIWEKLLTMFKSS